MSKSIYDLKLNETLPLEQSQDPWFFTTVMKVPGGWFYRSYDKQHNIATGVFVPYNSKYNKKINAIKKHLKRGKI